MALVAIVVALVISPASAQLEELTVNLTSLSADDESSAQTVVTVLDGESRPVVDLVAEDFSVRLNGKKTTLSSLERGVDSTLPISVLLALDVSGSMDGGALDQAKAAAISFLQALEPQDSVSILTFADGVNLVLPFTTDKAVASAAIEGLVAAGETALYQATEDGLRLAAEEGSSYRAVILLSDGLDNGSSVAQEDVLGTAATLGVPVFVIGLGQDLDRQYLESLATLSGGSFAETPSPAGLAQLYNEAAELLRGQYILTLDISGLAFVASEPAILRVDISLGQRFGGAERAVCAQELCVALGQVIANERLLEARTITADVISSTPIDSVSLLIDGTVAVTVSEPPYEFALDPATFENGNHALSVVVATAGVTAESRQVTVTFGAASGGISSLLLLGIGVVVAGVVAAGAMYLFLRRRPRGKLRRLDPENLRPPSREDNGLDAALNPKIWPQGSQEPSPALATSAAAVTGRLYASGGTLTGQSFPVGASPVSIGSGESCAIKLTHEVGDDEQVAAEYMRVWIRDGRLMVHEIRRMTDMGAEGGRWAKLEPGEVLPLGPYTLRFELDGQEHASEAVPNVLRDPAPVNEENEQRTKAQPKQDPAAPNVLRDPAPVNEDSEQRTKAQPKQDPAAPNVEDEPTSSPDMPEQELQPEA